MYIDQKLRLVGRPDTDRFKRREKYRLILSLTHSLSKQILLSLSALWSCLLSSRLSCACLLFGHVLFVSRPATQVGVKSRCVLFWFVAFVPLCCPPFVLFLTGGASLCAPRVPCSVPCAPAVVGCVCKSVSPRACVSHSICLVLACSITPCAIGAAFFRGPVCGQHARRRSIAGIRLAPPL